ncbi:MAG: hypothetical protein Fur0040_09930 [Sideroxydans sp.]
MKKLLILLTMVGMTASMPGLAADSSWWDSLRKKIETMTPKKKLSTTTAAGGVRGSLADAEDVYWKGENGGHAVDADELAAFKQAMDMVGGGKQAEARDAFAAFIKQYPASSLKADAEAALAQLQGH